MAPQQASTRMCPNITLPRHCAGTQQHAVTMAVTTNTLRCLFSPRMMPGLHPGLRPARLQGDTSQSFTLLPCRVVPCAHATRFRSMVSRVQHRIRLYHRTSSTLSSACKIWCKPFRKRKRISAHSAYWMSRHSSLLPSEDLVFGN